MSVNMYRLYAIQSFDGEKIAVYVKVGAYPEAKILSDAMSIVKGNYSWGEVVGHSDLTYDPSMAFQPTEATENRDKLNHYSRLLKRSKRILDESGPVSKAIFVEHIHPATWRGEHTLYENKAFDLVKADTPEYTACTPVGTINI
jgi:hypothetical protein